MGINPSIHYSLFSPLTKFLVLEFILRLVTILWLINPMPGFKLSSSLIGDTLWLQSRFGNGKLLSNIKNSSLFVCLFSSATFFISSTYLSFLSWDCFPCSLSSPWGRFYIWFKIHLKLCFLVTKNISLGYLICFHDFKHYLVSLELYEILCVCILV